jgi:transcriptional regulator of acetoin/glycerol metabolism
MPPSSPRRKFPLAKTLHPHAKGILEHLDQVAVELDPARRAELFADLGADYCEAKMYGRGIAMYEQSIAEQPSLRIKTRLAVLLISLYGEPGIARAIALLGDHDLDEIMYDGWSINTWMRLKQDAVSRQQQKAALEQRQPNLRDIVGESPPVINICEQILTYAPTSLPILITGPTGSGKEVVAKTIHACSRLSKRDFVAQNCASLPDTLLESELFGYARGAFTDADPKGKPGRFELANNGTLFLDEVGDLSLAAQAKILRALQEQEIERLGGTSPIKVNVRLIAATNKNLTEAVREHQFREDLLSRLSGARITLPPLGQRVSDLPLLARRFLNKYGLKSADGPFSDYDIHRWVQVEYLGRGKPLFEWLQKSPLRPEGSIRDFEYAVRRAVANGELKHYGDYSFVDNLIIRFEGDEFRWILGPRVVSANLEYEDYKSAHRLCHTRRAVARLLGVSESTLSRRRWKGSLPSIAEGGQGSRRKKAKAPSHSKSPGGTSA